MDYKVAKTINNLVLFTKMAKEVTPLFVGVSTSEEEATFHFSEEVEQSVIDQIVDLQEPTIPTLEQIIKNNLRIYRTKTVELVDQIMIENTLQGMTDAQSAYLFTKINPAIDAIQLGALPTARYLISNSEIDDVFTQAKKDRYIQLIEGAMVI